jgi:hypothetical protein
VPIAGVASFQDHQILDLDLAGSGYVLSAGSRYDLWLVVKGENVFTWAINSTGDVGPRILSVDYASLPTVYGSGTRGAFRVDVPEPGAATLFLAVLGLTLARLGRVRSSAFAGLGAPARRGSGSPAG